MSRRPFLSALALLFVTSRFSAHAEIMVGETLEYLTDTCPQIAIYRVVDTTQSINGFRGELVESLRGNPPREFRFDGVTNAKTLAVGDEELCFLRSTGKEMRWEETIPLTHPAVQGNAALRPDFSICTKKADILVVVRLREETYPLQEQRWRQYPASRLQVEIPGGTPAWKAVFGGSACFLLVPPDLIPVTRRAAKEWRLKSWSKPSPD